MALDENYIQRAADITMIQDLMARYALALDYPLNGGKDYADIFTDDGIFAMPEMFVEVRGRQELIEFAEGLHRTVPGLHHVITNLAIDIDGDKARGRCELNEFMLRREAIYSNLHAWYEDDMVRRGDKWLFKIRRVHVTEDMANVLTTGKIGEYFEGFLGVCQRFVRK